MWIGLTADVEKLTNTLAFGPVKKHMNKLDMDVSFYDLPTRELANLGVSEPAASDNRPLRPTRVVVNLLWFQ